MREEKHGLEDLHELFEGNGSGSATPDLGSRLAASLLGALGGRDERNERELRPRIVVDKRLREELSHDQNVYLGPFFTRRLTRAVPDLAFLPIDRQEASCALAWARREGVPVTLRGAATTAMGGAVANSAGLVIDPARLDEIEIDLAAGCVRFGAGTRLRELHAALARVGRALPVYPSNLGGTYAGWLATGGLGMNARGRGAAHDPLLSIELCLPDGECIELARDGSMLVSEQGERRRLSEQESQSWFRARGRQPIVLADLVGSEGQLGMWTALEVEIEARPELAAFLLSFDRRSRALAAVAWLTELESSGQVAPLNLKLLSASHMDNTRRVWAEEDRQGWRTKPGALVDGSELPFAHVQGPADFGIRAAGGDDGVAKSYLFVDFSSAAEGHEFAASLEACPGDPLLRHEESVRFARERFRPQQTKRLGPALLAAEVLLPAERVEAYLDAAERLARRAGSELDAEVYYAKDGQALVLAAYLADHRRGSFLLSLLLAPMLMDLALARFSGRPYVLGRWQASFFQRRFNPDRAARLRRQKKSLDPEWGLGPGSFFDMKLSGLLGALIKSGMHPGIRFLRWLVTAAPLPFRGLHLLLDRFADGPAAGRGLASGESGLGGCGPTARALHCVNCGECNAVCPIFHEAGIRLPQILTHLGESVQGGEALGASGSTLLDLCMRCGNCQEVCQAGIPHLSLYEAMQTQSDSERPQDEARHRKLLEHLRASPRYLREFLGVRPGGYERRAEVALPGSARYMLLRSEAEAGPAATCIHCGACVPVCPTEANHEYGSEDLRLITTDQERCIGCGTCVEVCPANLANGGQTLRVMEAPTLDWLAAVSEFEAQESAR